MKTASLAITWGALVAAVCLMTIGLASPGSDSGAVIIGAVLAHGALIALAIQAARSETK